LKSFRWLAGLFLILAVLSPNAPVAAQESGGPIYIVQEGDTLWSIALRFGVSLDELARVNGLTDPSQLAIGAQLIIPGLPGIQGKLGTRAVAYGETLRSLSRRFQVSPGDLARLNRLVSPMELYAGSNLIVLEDRAAAGGARRGALRPGQSLLELAVLSGSDPWALAATNSLSDTWGILPGDIIRLPGDAPDGPGALPEAIASVELAPQPLVQGQTAVMKISLQGQVNLSGQLIDRNVHFFELQPGQWVALQGIHAMLEPGFYPLTLNGALPDGAPFRFTQLIFIQDGQYLFDKPLTVPAETIDPAVTEPENQQWAALMAPVTAEKLWQDGFTFPSPLFAQDYCVESGECWTSVFGSRRSYNGSEYTYFHTGLDFAGGAGTEILAPAAGMVVFADFLTVRGNATVIDHGWGVYTAYMHQSELRVKPGDRVEPGQVIGLVGGTGRVEGPHLHFEVVVGGVQVDPIDWLSRAYP
jgi:murein DD-endopeptidase MepM/ murein hydrolase activator NlpD